MALTDSWKGKGNIAPPQIIELLKFCRYVMQLPCFVYILKSLFFAQVDQLCKGFSCNFEVGYRYACTVWLSRWTRRNTSVELFIPESTVDRYWPLCTHGYW